jgi:hypothetical protein
MKPSQSSAQRPARPAVLLWVGVAAFGVLAVSHILVIQRLNALTTQQRALESQISIDSARTAAIRDQQDSENRVQESPRRQPNGANFSSSTLELQNQVAALVKRVDELTASSHRVPGTSAVAEYNVANPPSDSEPSTQSVQPTRRSWGHEQSLGPPDTTSASDAPTAWAARQPDAGAEWLSLDFDQSVDVAEVRIRESFNPGAITKVSGIVNGQEITLWEGRASTGPAPRDFIVPVAGNIQAGSIVVHLDTSLVPGWNEIDAVELVGRDGSRQWATGSSASSTFAERASGAGNESLPGQYLLERTIK